MGDPAASDADARGPGAPDLVLIDGSRQVMTPPQAQAFARAHDRLVAENQGAFLVLASENKDAYARALAFAMKNGDTE